MPARQGVPARAADDRITFRAFVGPLLRLTWPNSATSLVQFSLQLGASILVGNQLGTVYLAAASLAIMFSNITGFSVGTGLATSLDTLCSQAFGAREYMLVGRQTQRAMLVLTVACFPLAGLWLVTGPALATLGVDAELARLAGQYCARLIPGMWPSFMFEALRRYMQAQHVLWPVVTACAIASGFSVLCNILLVIHLGWGLHGAAYTMALSNWVLFISIVCLIWGRARYNRRKSGGKGAYALVQARALNLEDDDDAEEGDDDLAALRVKDDGAASGGGDANKYSFRETWPTPSRECFKGWWEVLRLGLPGAASLFIEWGAFEVAVFMCSFLGTVPLAAHVVNYNTVAVWYSIPSGMGAAASITVGNYLGEQKPYTARTVAFYATMIAGTWALFVSILFQFIGLYWARLFSPADEEVVQDFMWTLPVLGVYGVVDATKALTTGVMRGAGRQALTVACNILAYVVVAYPNAYLMTFPFKHGLRGVWGGLVIAQGSASIIYGIILLRSSWPKLAEKAQERIARAQAALVVAAPLNLEAVNSLTSTKSGDSIGPAHPDAELDERPLISRGHHSRSLEDEML